MHCCTAAHKGKNVVFTNHVFGKEGRSDLVAGVLCEQGEPLHPPEVPLRGADVHLSRMWTGFQEQEESTGTIPMLFSGLYTNTNTNTKTNTNNLFPPNPMRYNKMHNVITILNNKAQLSVFLSSL
jgi:hypothetical protein